MTQRHDDLGHGWELVRYPDGSANVRSSRTGQRIDLPADSVERLKRIIRAAEDPTAGRDWWNPTEAGQVFDPDGAPMREAE